MQHHSHELPPPASIEAEEGVLSCLLYNPSQMQQIADILKPEHFYRDRHAVIYRAMLALHSRDVECTPFNLIDELERQGRLDEVGGASQFFDYPEMIYTLKQASTFAATIARTYTLRRLLETLGTIADMAYKQEEHTLEVAEALISDIALEGVTAAPYATFAEAIDRYIENFDERRRDFQQGITGGLPTGLSDLDRLLGGLRKSRLYTIASRPGYGKTALSLTIALYVAAHAKHALFFSLEMDEDEIVERALAADMEVDQSLLRDADVSDGDVARLKSTARRLRQHDLKLADRTYVLADIRTQARAAHLKRPLDLIVVDYLQLIDAVAGGRGKNETRAEEVAKISKELKKLARELKVPILALAQMNRESERRGNALPQLSDLGESSGIEKDSDCVMFIYCNDEEMIRREQNLPYDLSIIVRKHRNGRMGTVPLRFRPKLTKFQNQEARYEGEVSDDEGRG